MWGARHPVGLKTMAAEHSCKFNGHLTQWGRLGYIVIHATSAMRTLASLDWSQQPGSFNGINGHISMTKVSL